MQKDFTERMKDTLEGIAGAVLPAALVVGVLGTIYNPWWPVQIPKHAIRSTYVATVTDKVFHASAEKYLVTTRVPKGPGVDEVRVFENTDSYPELKWNSSTVQGELEVGKRYEISAYGVRWPFFSAFENILSVREIKQPEESSARPSHPNVGR